MPYAGDTHRVWRVWSGGSTATTVTNTAATQLVWRRWAENTAVTTAATDTWGIWATDNSTATTTTTSDLVWMDWVRLATAEPPQVRHTVQSDNWRAAREAERKKKAEAAERAMTLLRSCLSDQQNRDLRDHGHFFVDADSGRRYRISKGTHGNVKVVNKQTGQWIESLCIQPRDVPVGDSMLAQKLMIEAAEEVFRSYANITLREGGMVYGKGGLLTGDKVIDLERFRREREAA